MKKKSGVDDYNNISAKLIEYHNVEVVPTVKKYLNYGAIKLKRQRVLLQRDRLESDEKPKYGHYDHYKYDHNFTVEYMIMNKFIIDNLPASDREAFMDLFNDQYNSDNCIIGAHMMYSLVEAKKKEIINLLKEANEL
jgi:hypothetical protein